MSGTSLVRLRSWVRFPPAAPSNPLLALAGRGRPHPSPHVLKPEQIRHSPSKRGENAGTLFGVCSLDPTPGAEKPESLAGQDGAPTATPRLRAVFMAGRFVCLERAHG